MKNLHKRDQSSIIKGLRGIYTGLSDFEELSYEYDDQGLYEAAREAFHVVNDIVEYLEGNNVETYSQDDIFQEDW